MLGEIKFVPTPFALLRTYIWKLTIRELGGAKQGQELTVREENNCHKQIGDVINEE